MFWVIFYNKSMCVGQMFSTFMGFMRGNALSQLFICVDVTMSGHNENPLVLYLKKTPSVHKCGHLIFPSWCITKWYNCSPYSKFWLPVTPNIVENHQKALYFDPFPSYLVSESENRKCENRFSIFRWEIWIFDIYKIFKSCFITNTGSTSKIWVCMPFH